MKQLFRNGIVGLTAVVLAVTPQGYARTTPAKHKEGISFEITVPGRRTLTGRLLLILSRDRSGEPRFQTGPGYDSQEIFGVAVDHLKPGATITVDSNAPGFPMKHLSQLPSGDYTVQAMLNVYDEFHLATGKDVWLPLDRGEGQQWNTKPGNSFSTPFAIHIDAGREACIPIVLDKIIPPITDNWLNWNQKHPAESRWIRYVRVRSPRLSAFWGSDIYLRAIVLLPEGWAEHPKAHYPVVVFHDHFRDTFNVPARFRITAPSSDATGEDKIQQAYAYKLYQDWTSGGLPHVIVVTIQHPTPYYDDSYAVNSASMGPYGDAINYELLPEIEQDFRGLGQGWARAVFGSSTGGWEALAAQVFYPDMYNGAWVNCPDPVDFRAYQTVNIYKDKNAYHRDGPFAEIPIADGREIDGNIYSTTALSNRYEYVLASHGRSGGQWDIWQAVFSPQGEDGYPKPIYDKRTGVIDPSVATYWRQHYDLSAIMLRRWDVLGPQLEGKLHFAVGESDSFFLNNAVHLLQSELEATRHPHSDATFDYGPRQPHGYTGIPNEPVNVSEQTTLQRFLPEMVRHMLATAPPGADTISWRY